MIIKILGTGCPKCRQTKAIVAEVIQEHNIDATVINVSDILQIVGYNVLNIPTLVINEKVTISGRIPSKEEVLALIKEA